jgi:hypothetical protein
MAIGAIVIGHTITAEDGDTLSECVDSWLDNHRWVTRGAIVVLALHLMNAVPGRVDVVHLLFTGARSLYPLRRCVAGAIAPPNETVTPTE